MTFVYRCVGVSSSALLCLYLSPYSQQWKTLGESKEEAAWQEINRLARKIDRKPDFLLIKQRKD